MKQYLFLFLIVGFAQLAKAQDVIVTKDGEEIEICVLDITENYVYYKHTKDLEGPTERIDAQSVFMVKYDTGHKEMLLEEDEKKVEDLETLPKRPQIGYTIRKDLYRFSDGFIGGFTVLQLFKNSDNQQLRAIAKEIERHGKVKKIFYWLHLVNIPVIIIAIPVAVLVSPVAWAAPLTLAAALQMTAAYHKKKQDQLMYDGVEIYNAAVAD